MLAAGLFLAGCAHQTQFEPRDPLEPINRVIFKFNDTADRFVLRPLAVGYDKVTPDIVQMGVSSFFSNLFYPVTVVNQYAQGKWQDGTSDLGRFVVNTTVGLAGFVDVASHWGLPPHREDFGQTLGAWGVGEGWFLVIPFLGPSTNRDLVGMVADAPFSPLYYVENRDPLIALTALNIVQIRAGLLGADAILNEQDDRYAFLRSAYLQQRQSAVRDGAPPPMDDFDALLDEDLDNF